MIGKIIDDHYILAKMIRAQYYLPKKDAIKREKGEKISLDDVQPIKFTFCQNFWLMFLSCKYDKQKLKYHQ